ncbi:MAG TPA: HlyD family secretion protein [Caulobacteraceae bacterium]
MTDTTHAPSAPPSPPPSATWSPARHHPLVTAAFVGVIAVGVLVVLAAWNLPPFAGPNQATEDAYVQGLTTVISPQVSGYVLQVPVDDFQQAPEGRVLVVIDPSPYQQRVEQAKAELDAKIADLANNQQTLERSHAGVATEDAAEVSAQAQLAKAQADLKRSADLMRDGSLSVRENDQNVAAAREAEATLAQAQAQRRAAVEQVRSTEVNEGALKAAVEAARAQLDSARIDLGHTVIHAPQNGQLSEVGVRVGQYVTNGSQLMFLVPATRWVTANFKEAQTHRMRPGQAAWFTVDALAGERLKGHVERLSPATGSEFAVLKPDNATGNFTKVPQRIAVRISIDPGQAASVRLRPGMSVEAHVDTAGGSGS